MNPLTRMNIRGQLVIVFILLVSPIFVLNGFTGESAKEILKNQVTDAYVELIKQNHTIIDSDIDTVNKIMTTIILNPLTQAFSDEKQVSEQTPVQKYQDMHEFLASHSMGINGGETIRYSFFVPDKNGDYSFAPDYRSRNSSFVFFFSEDEKPEWYDEAVERKGKGALKIIENYSVPSRSKTVAFIRAVNDLSKGNNVIGVLVATNVDQRIGDSVNTVSLPAGNTISVTDLNNKLYYGNGDNAAIGSTVRLPAKDAFIRTGSDVDYVIDDDYIHVAHSNYSLGHKLIYRIPTHSLVEQQNKLKSYIQLISVAYFVLFFLVMLYFLRSLITPLLKMVTFFKVYEPGKSLPELKELDRKDEVGSLVSSIHDMADRFNQLVHDKYIMEIRHKEAQLHLLYQQINPHLLYNTLESVYWKCILQGENEAADMIKDLSKLMRISLSRGKELITIEEELEHAKAYVNLQQKRFEYGFKVNWNIAVEVGKNLIPKVSLQPIIENAIIHGVRHMEEDGEITISAGLHEDTVTLLIEDNGYKEVDVEAINQSLLVESGEDSSGYGARNVHKRIQLHFGQEYGLSYERREDQGIRVKMTLPKQTD